MQTRKLGPCTVSAIGHGAMPADIYSPSWDTMGHNELIVGKAAASWGGGSRTTS